MLVSALPLVVLDHPFVVVSIVASIITLVYRTYAATPFSRDLPLVREKNGAKRFSILTRVSFYFTCSKLYRDVYESFSKRGQAVLVPTLGARVEIFLPHSSMKWALSQPSTVLGMWEAFNEMFQLGHSLGDEKYMIDTWPHLLARHVLTQELDDYILPVNEELKLAIDNQFGSDTENWKTLDLLDSMRMVVNQAGSRFAVGSSLCRDEDYLRTIMSAIDGVVANAGITGFMPTFMRPFISPIASYDTRKKLSKLEAKYEELFQERIKQMEATPTDISEDPVDLLQKMLRYAQKYRPEELATNQMTRRLLMANLGFVYQASFAMSNMLMNIVESDLKHSTIEVLRNEAASILAANGSDPVAIWTKPNIARMVYADSAARETLRLDAVATRALVRKVMVDGVSTDTGLPLPKGTLVSFVSQPMHTDAELFEDPNTFDPFRFVKMREQAAQNASAKTMDDSPATGPDHGGGAGLGGEHSFLSTANILIFGRGRNACPGRFLVDYQLKMMISHLFTNYDIKFPVNYKGRRPANRWLLEFIFPPNGVKVEVKRRK